MIEHLRGTLIVKDTGHIIVECGGVGYGLEVPHSTFRALPAVESEVRLTVHFQMRESEISLYGFATEDERKLFRILLSVQSIGPKVALTILSTLSSDDLIRAIMGEDLPVLTSVPGIGKKTAERLLIELREPLKKFAKALPAPQAELEIEGDAVPGVTREMRDRAVEALVQLGTKPANAVRAVQKATKTLAEEPGVESLVKEGLKHR